MTELNKSVVPGCHATENFISALVFHRILFCLNMECFKICNQVSQKQREVMSVGLRVYNTKGISGN